MTALRTPHRLPRCTHSKSSKRERQSKERASPGNRTPISGLRARRSVQSGTADQIGNTWDSKRSESTLWAQLIAPSTTRTPRRVAAGEGLCMRVRLAGASNQFDTITSCKARRDEASRAQCALSQATVRARTFWAPPSGTRGARAGQGASRARRTRRRGPRRRRRRRPRGRSAREGGRRRHRRPGRVRQTRGHGFAGVRSSQWPSTQTRSLLQSVSFPQPATGAASSRDEPGSFARCA